MLRKVWYILSFSLLLFPQITENKFAKFKKGLQIDFIEQCEYTEYSPCLIFDIELTTGKYGSIVSSVANCTKEFPMQYQMEAIAQRCKNKESLDTCEAFQPVRSKAACSLMELKHQAWTPFIESFTPAFKCPIKPAMYYQRNAEFEPDYFAIFPLNDYFWKVKFNFYTEKNQLMFSVCTDVKIAKFIVT